MKALEKNLPDRLFPARMRVLDGSMLKLLAMLLMLIDHVAHLFRVGAGVTLFSLGGFEMTLYEALRHVGRLAFPLFAFLLVEGFLHTRNRKNYAIRLSLFAVLSEIPFDLFCSGRFFYERQNVFFTLLLGFLGLCALEHLTSWRRILSVTGLFLIAFALGADYSWTGYLLILLLYALRDIPALRSLSITGVIGIAAGAAALPMALYNGKRGFVGGRVMKYAFYAFYPVHLLLLALIKILF